MFTFLKKKPKRKKITFCSEAAKESYDLMVNQNEKLSNSRLILFTENWASLMEEVIRTGVFTEESIKRCRKEADRLCGSKGRDYFLAKHILITHWKYGFSLMDEKDQTFYAKKEKFYVKKKAY